MLQQIREVSPKFYQLALFNIGLIIAISKELSPLHIASSLVFIILLVAPIALYFNILQLDNAKVIHEAIQEKVSKLCTFSLSFVKTWSELEQSKQIRYITNVLPLLARPYSPCISQSTSSAPALKPSSVHPPSFSLQRCLHLFLPAGGSRTHSAYDRQYVFGLLSACQMIAL
jgi:hypothetical protein